jgi:uncharacterized membrane protein YkgB
MKDMRIERMDNNLIHFFRRVSLPLARIGLFIIFFWFGLLKVIGQSPASPLVSALFNHTISFMSFGNFMVLFGLFECLIGLLFLIKGAERIVIPLLFLHMVATFIPLFLLPEITWTHPFVPTLEGQYILKNILVIATAIGIAAHLHPLKNRAF